ncbi:MAG: hypothetical protein LBM12_02465 [Candidatus Nomurabacteria bacterium]|jgi:hypothetical protein|nr:hypothetical protein [Candidatus Nomurabacteria bacterium]
MPEPKKQSSPRKTGLRRSHIRLDLAKKVNSKSPVKAFLTRKQTPNVKVAVPKKSTKASGTVKAAKSAKKAK